VGVSLIKETPLAREGLKLQFRTEVFNVFNLVNFGLPANVVLGPGLWCHQPHGGALAADPAFTEGFVLRRQADIFIDQEVIPCAQASQREKGALPGVPR
jgi:hypothetical protein